SQDQKVAPVTHGVGSGRVNAVTAEEAQEAPDVVLGTLSVNSHPATVLFDSGASHSFVSESFAAVGEFLFTPLLVPLLVRSPGSEMRAEFECRDVLIEVEGVEFFANLILLHSASLDVILGMDWLSQHMGQIDCARKLIYLTSPSSEHVRFSPKLQGPHLFALEAKPAPDISEVPTVRDFVDVFPDELPGMPPVRDLEFVIELAPGTTPILKRPYRMPPNELVELKNQLGEL
ncbi:hypothetical protein JGD54_25460, partial [Salmonella enterica subsp. enterica serovar Typhimurium]|nr:hypothetical protein [Salmonella enterica subsp. enterica serovar Typhimurium]